MGARNSIKAPHSILFVGASKRRVNLGFDSLLSDLPTWNLFSSATTTGSRFGATGRVKMALQLTTRFIKDFQNLLWETKFPDGQGLKNHLAVRRKTMHQKACGDF